MFLTQKALIGVMFLISQPWQIRLCMQQLAASLIKTSECQYTPEICETHNSFKGEHIETNVPI